MSFPYFHRALPTLLIALLLTALAACGGKESGDLRPDPAFARYIPAHTGGHISARSNIRIQLADDLVLREEAVTDPAGLISIRPKVEGTTAWADARTLVFTPTERLKQDEGYTVEFALGKLTEVPKEHRSFRFGVHTWPQQVDARLTDMAARNPNDLRWQAVELGVHTSDHAEPGALEEAFSAEQNGRRLSLHWQHDADGMYHRVLADSVMRGDQAGSIRFHWEGKPIGGKEDGSLEVAIPSLNTIAWLDATTTANPPSVSLLFSDPLDPGQELSGLGIIDGVDHVNISVEGNRLVLHPRDQLNGDHTVLVSAGLRNTMGRKLGTDLSIDVKFEAVEPNVRFVGNGTILPSTDGLVVPFEAVNLRAVDVRVIRIPADNVSQFLQVNKLDGERELVRVGRPVLQTTIQLDAQGNSGLNNWQRYHLDIDKLVRTEPGAIYRVTLGFRRAHSGYPCGDGDAPLTTTSDDSADNTDWDTPNDYGYYYYDDWYWEGDEDYDYRRRDDPCHASYYRNKRYHVHRNILASDIGLIAKRGNDGSLQLATSDLRSAQPMIGVELQVLDLQRQLLAKVTTDGKGLARVASTRHKPFLVVAQKDGQRAYLRLDDGSALNISSFDVGGESVDKGLKGFLYGERGVWRPGDSLYLTFILQQAAAKLPADHPVVLELTDPEGRMDQRLVRTRSVNGFYDFRCATDVEAPTGVWQATVHVGGTTFRRSLRIETVKPNRLKIDLRTGDGPLVAGDQRRVQLGARWLHGAPAPHLAARVTASFTRIGSAFKGFDKYSFEDLRSDLDTDEHQLFDGELDGQGQTSFQLKPELGHAPPAAVRMNLVTRVFEQGGDASTDRTEVTYLPYNSYVGLQAPAGSGYWNSHFTDTTYRVDVVTLTPEGKPRAGRAVEARIYKVGYDWWWDGSTEGRSSYVHARSSRLISETKLTTDAKGRTTLPFRIDRPLWGRFIVQITDPASGHVAATELYLDWPGYAGRSRREGASEAAMLRFNTDKEEYAVGDRCELIIPSPAAGKALISLENGSRVLEAQWIDVKAGETRHSFTVTPEMAPNIHAYVQLVQPHSAVPLENDLPIRLYGVVPVKVTDPATRLAPLLAAPKEVRTDEEFTVTVSEEKGRAMTYTLAIVDEGLLDLTRFRTPDPWNYFYAREALGVRTWDLYDQVIGAVGRQLQRVLAIGGSDQVDPKAAAKVNRFKPVVRFVGPFSLGKGKKADHRFTLDNYVGSVRVMVVAGDGSKAYGHTEATMPVRKPLMVLATVPRVVGPEETVELPVNVFAMDPKVRDVRVTLVANDRFQVEGGNQRTIRFDKPGDQLVVFRAKVAGAVGAGSLTFRAEGHGEKAEERVDVAVRVAQSARTLASEEAVAPGANWKAQVEPLGITGTNSAYLEVSTLPGLDLGRRLQYLVQYPHGCLEQTTSGAFPQVFLADVLELDEATRKEMRHNVEAGMRRIQQHQTADGGLAYWPGGSQSDPWSTVWATHFVVEAERAGYAGPAQLKTRLEDHLRRVARERGNTGNSTWSADADQLVQAYRLYVLALANKPDQAAMNRLRSAPTLGARARWMLAAAYGISGRADVARTLVDQLTTNPDGYTEHTWTYGSSLRDAAVIAEALHHMGDGARAQTVLRGIIEKLNSGSWYSTQSTAWGLLAVARQVSGDKRDAPMRFSATVNGKTIEKGSTRAVVRIPLEGADRAQAVSIRNSGEKQLHVRIVRTGTPLIGEEVEQANELVMRVRYEDMNGQRIAPERLVQGTDLQAVVTVYHPGVRDSYANMALTQVFPSGWEIRNDRLDGATLQDQRQSYADYRDVRDDRVMTYFGLGRRQESTFRVRLTAAYTGRYYLPGAHCAAMYDNTIMAVGAGQWVEVVAAP